MQKEGIHIYEFGPFRFIPEQQLLLRSGKPVPLTPKAFDLLHILVRNHGFLLEKEELMHEIWGDAFVEESNLTQTISVLRRALGESSRDPRYIETLPRRGYRFTAQVQKVQGNNGDWLAEPLAVSGEGEEGGDEPVAETHHGNPPSDEEASPGSAAGHDHFWGRFGLRPRRSVAVLLTLVVSVLCIGFVTLKLTRHSRSARPSNPAEAQAPFASLEIARLTTTGRAVAGATSPDGKLAAYIEEERGERSLWIKQIATASVVQVIPPTRRQLDDLTFSRDGNYLYFLSPARSGASTLHRIPVFGGDADEVIEGVDSKITLAPDGSRFAFIRRSPNRGKRVLMVANADGTREQVLAESKLPEYFTNGGPAWSPDGTVIACVVGNLGTSVQMNVVAVKVADGSQRPITRQSLSAITGLCWLPEGRGLFITATDQWGRLFRQIWHLSYPEGEARRMTNDLNDYEQLSLSDDGSTLLAVQTNVMTGIWAKGGAAVRGETRNLISGKFEGFYGLSLTAAGKIVYASLDSGNEDLWMMDEDGGDRRQLTRDAHINMNPDACPDGNHIVFVSDRSGAPHVWVMDGDGDNQRQLTHGSNEMFPSCTADGKVVVYSGYEDGKRTLWKIPIEGGTATRLTESEAQRPDVSPDGREIAFYYRESSLAPWSLGVIPIDGGQVRSYQSPSVLEPSRGPVRWTADGRGLAYVDDGDGSSNVWLILLEGGQPFRLTDFAGEQIFSYDISPGGKQVVCARGSDLSDVVLISNLL